MSVFDLLFPNGYNLNANKLTTNELVSKTLTSTNVDVDELQITSYGLFKVTTVGGLTGDPILSQLDNSPITITLKYLECGVATIFYDSVTAISTSASIGIDCAEIRLGSSTTNFNIIGFPEIRDAGISNPNPEYNHVVYITSGSTSVSTVMKVKKINATTCNVSFVPFAGGNFPNAGISINPFTFDYIVQN